MKRIINISALVFLLVLFAFSVSAVGIGGPNLKKTVDFAPGKEFELKYILIPSDEPMDYGVVAEPLPGSEVDITKYVSFDSTLFKDVPPKKKKVFAAKVKMPENTPVSGLHGAKICVEETKATSGTVGLKTSACAQLFISVDSVKKETRQDPDKIIEKAEAPVIKNALEKSGEKAEPAVSKKVISGGDIPKKEPVSKRAVVRISALLAALLCAGIIARGMYYRFR